jgi:hypothetical protein
MNALNILYERHDFKKNKAKHDIIKNINKCKNSWFSLGFRVIHDQKRLSNLLPMSIILNP